MDQIQHRDQAVFEGFVKLVCKSNHCRLMFQMKPSLDPVFKQCCCQHYGLWWFWLKETGPQARRNIWWDSSHLPVSTYASENAQNYQSQNHQQKAEVKGWEMRQTLPSCQEPSALGQNLVSLNCSTIHIRSCSPACSTKFDSKLKETNSLIKESLFGMCSVPTVIQL